MSKITDFYKGGVDADGRRLIYIINETDEWWEGCHDHVQWVFPTSQPSQYNSNAPLLTTDDQWQFQSDPVMQGYLRLAFDRFLQFIGAEKLRNGNIVPAMNFFDRAKDIWSQPNHNWLRITRVLTCLRLCGLTDEACMFYHFLKQVRAMFPRHIADDTWRFWTEAYNPKRDADVLQGC